MSLDGRLEQERENAWPSTASPARDSVADRAAPSVEHERITTARPGEPLTLTARVTDPSGVQSVRLRYRHVTQVEDYATLDMLDMAPAGRPGMYSAMVPGAAVSGEWDFMYFIEAIDKAGNGRMWPDLEKETP